MRYLIFLFLSGLFISCEDLSPEEQTQLIGSWKIERVNVLVNGESHKASDRKMSEMGLNQLKWVLNADLTLEEYFSSARYSQKYVFDNSGNLITVTGFYVYPRQFFLQLNANQLRAITPEIRPAGGSYTTESWQKQVITDATYLLDGVITREKVQKAEGLQIQYIFRKLIQ